MTLNQTQYPNNSRIVSGTPAIFQDDVVLLCNTNVGPVTINLLEIPDNYWNTTWKLYIVDNSSNASVNNITINAGVGQTINNQSSVVLSTNGSSVIVRISSNNKYIVDGLNPPIQAYTTVEDEGVALVQRSTIDFQGTGVTATDNGSKTIVTINTPPTQQAYTTVQDEGVALTQRSTIDFQGTGVTATDNGSKTIVTINTPPTQQAYTTVEDEGVALVQRSTIDFQGTGVTATDNGSKTIVTIPSHPALTVSSTCSPSIPNTTDVYAYIDITSGPYVGNCATQNKLVLAQSISQWFSNYQLANPNYNGNLYLFEYGQPEDYLGLPRSIKLGTIPSYASGLTWLNPADGTTIGAITPTNWNTPNWVAPTSILFIAFVNESENRYHGSSSPPSLISGVQQPTNYPFPNGGWTYDYANFVSDYNTHWDYFKGVIYPANDLYSNAKNFLLHAYAATTNSSNISSAELSSALGTNFDASFNSITYPIANVYVSQNVGLWNYGWNSILNKSVTNDICGPDAINFTPQEFADDLNSILSGGAGADVVSIINSWDEPTQSLELRGLKSSSLDLTIDNEGCINIENNQSSYNRVQNEGVNLNQRSTIDFQGTGVTATDNGSKTIVTVNQTTLGVSDTSTIDLTVSGGPAYSLSADIQDTGWLNLNGFDYCSSASFRPQCRRIGKQIVFRGSIIVPMGNSLDGGGGIVVSTPFSDSYDGLLYGKTFNTLQSSNAINSCKLYTHGDVVWTGSGIAIRLEFNRGNSVLPSGLFPTGVTALDLSYATPRQVGIRTVTTSIGNKKVNLSTIALLSIDNNGILSLLPVTYNELFASSTSGYQYSSIQRNMISNIFSGELVPQFSYNSPSQYNSNSPGTYAPNLTTINDTWAFSQDLGNATDLGGVTLVLNGLTAFI